MRQHQCFVVLYCCLAFSLWHSAAFVAVVRTPQQQLLLHRPMMLVRTSHHHHHHHRLKQQQDNVISLGMAKNNNDNNNSNKQNKKKKKKKRQLGLLTFDLDDSLYPIAPVLDEANAAFARSMSQFGYRGINPTDIVETCKQIRHELEENGQAEQAAILTHTEIRLQAIRREMEKVIFQRKLQETADDWATPVSDLSPIVKNFAKKWAAEAVSPSVVQAVMNAWEMERHHAAERHLYPEVLEVLSKIRAQHPHVIVGAVTDGKANPLFMTFTLAKYFDFCLSWEDDQGGRQQFFQDLASVDKEAELKWIYDAAFEKYQELKQAKTALKKKRSNDEDNDSNDDKATDNNNNFVWIHVGDDLAYDVGGSAQSGAKTIWLELADKPYHQTARQRFTSTSEQQPSWSTTSPSELQARQAMNVKALDKVDATVHYLSTLPDAINEILEREEEGEEENNDNAGDEAVIHQGTTSRSSSSVKQ